MSAQNSNSAADSAQVVLTFLESIGQRADAEFYLAMFRKLPKESFAIVVVDAQVASAALGSVVEQLRFLGELGLFAPVVLGLFRPAKAAADAQRLSQKLLHAGLQSTLHSAVDPELAVALKSELGNERVPLITFDQNSPGDPSARLLLVAQLASVLESRKVVILRPQGGLRPRSKAVTLAGDDLLPVSRGGRGISVVNLRTDYQPLQEAGALLAHDSELLSNVNALMQGVADGKLAVSITSPLNMLRELFTVRGAGTLIKAGSKIERFSSYAGLDLPRLQALLESTFERTLSDTFWSKPVLDIYLEHEYRGTAIVEGTALGAFLTKFAVSRQAQGEGMGRDLWAAITRDHPRLYWRARDDNPISAWYTSHCHGMARTGEWTVFWRGLSEQDIPRAIHDARERPEDFASPHE